MNLTRAFVRAREIIVNHPIMSLYGLWGACKGLEALAEKTSHLQTETVIALSAPLICGAYATTLIGNIYRKRKIEYIATTVLTATLMGADILDSLVNRFNFNSSIVESIHRSYEKLSYATDMSPAGIGALAGFILGTGMTFYFNRK